MRSHNKFVFGTWMEPKMISGGPNQRAWTKREMVNTNKWVSMIDLWSLRDVFMMAEYELSEEREVTVLNCLYSKQASALNRLASVCDPAAAELRAQVAEEDVKLASSKTLP